MKDRFPSHVESIMIDEISPFSLVSQRLVMHFGAEELGIGTGFFYDHQNERFLVTNWHNVSGKNPNTGQPLSNTGGLPDQIIISLPVPLEREDGVEYVDFTDCRISLYSDEDRLLPNWWEHPLHGSSVDMVVIPWETKGFARLDPLNAPMVYLVKAANDQSLGLQQFTPTIGMDVFTLGFPRGMDGGGFAIWKRGSLATEPVIDLEGLPKIYIDTATREGMSGSPVFASKVKTWYDDKADGNAVIKTLVGVYSGRVGDDTFQAQLGVVWKECAIIEAIEGKMIGRSSF